ncbi:MAG: EamA/RhaT family transporter, partial [Bacillota bacterium]|nr:EamA/RhaT family transporter [Bacillota bacterium]
MKKLNLTNNFVVTVLALLCCLLWGSAFPCIKIGYELFEIGANDTFSQILFAGVRFTVAGALVILFSSVSAKKFLVPTERRTISRCFIL